MFGNSYSNGPDPSKTELSASLDHFKENKNYV